MDEVGGSKEPMPTFDAGGKEERERSGIFYPPYIADTKEKMPNENEKMQAK